MTQWLNQVTDSRSIDDTTLMVRISDNVLDDKDYGIDIIIFRTGIIVSQTKFKDGVYQLPNMVGWSTDEFVKWVQEDWSGSHPENYNEFKVLC